LALLFFLHKEHQRRVRRGFFDKNGGEIMKRMNIKTFTEVELKKMTNNYSELIGKGHFGNVFNGIITDNNQRVAVKLTPYHRWQEEEEEPAEQRRRRGVC
jgi:hypothetical protein